MVITHQRWKDICPHVDYAQHREEMVLEAARACDDPEMQELLTRMGERDNLFSFEDMCDRGGILDDIERWLADHQCLPREVDYLNAMTQRYPITKDMVDDSKKTVEKMTQLINERAKAILLAIQITANDPRAHECFWDMTTYFSAATRNAVRSALRNRPVIAHAITSDAQLREFQYCEDVLRHFFLELIMEPTIHWMSSMKTRAQELML